MPVWRKRLTPQAAALGGWSSWTPCAKEQSMPRWHICGSFSQKLQSLVGMKLLPAKRLGGMPAALGTAGLQGPPGPGKPQPSGPWPPSQGPGNAIMPGKPGMPGMPGLPAMPAMPAIPALPALPLPPGPPGSTGRREATAPPGADVGAGFSSLDTTAAVVPSVWIVTGSPSCTPISASPWAIGQASPCSQKAGCSIQNWQSSMGWKSSNFLGPWITLRFRASPSRSRSPSVASSGAAAAATAAASASWK
mmetsp:Transcript_85718/g.277643  ORF Transcript_85718/g.277643 Transcript_85718/m.277643 type:complete len:249 (-) Transcript_85718:212-958(-)